MKELNLKYTQLVCQGALNKLSVGVETEMEGFWRFYDEQSKKEIKFNSHSAILNFMHKNGWSLKLSSQNSNAPVNEYIFEKRE